MRNTKFLFVGGLIAVGLYYAYTQLNLLTNSVIRIASLSHVGISGGQINIQPDIEVHNPSDVAVNVNNLTVAAYIKKDNNWILSGHTPVPIRQKIEARQVTIVTR